jgi:hypothetical protein
MDHGTPMSIGAARMPLNWHSNAAAAAAPALNALARPLHFSQE